MSTPPERCPACSQVFTTVLAFQAHLKEVAGDEAHTAVLWSLLGVDYQTLKAEGGRRVEERAQARGWRLL